MVKAGFFDQLLFVFSCIFTAINDFQYEKRVITEDKRKALTVAPSRPGSEVSTRPGMTRRVSTKELPNGDLDSAKGELRNQVRCQITE